MRKLLILLTALLCFSLTSAQKQTIIPNGTLILKTGEKINFINLRFKDTQVICNNVATNKDCTYDLAQIKSIEGKAITVDAGEVPVQTVKAEAEEPDTRFRPDYPEGIYKTKEDFINKTPSSTDAIDAKELIGFEKHYISGIADNCFFYYRATDTKVKKVFAISYKGFLYFQLNAIFANRNQTDRAQTNDFPNSFVRVLTGGDHYFYTEAELSNQWAKAFGQQTGVVGSLAASSSQAMKGVVWDFKNKEFNIFKNCNDYNAFIAPLYAEGVQDCKNHHADIKAIRAAMEIIK